MLAADLGGEDGKAPIRQVVVVVGCSGGTGGGGLLAVGHGLRVAGETSVPRPQPSVCRWETARAMAKE